MDEYKQTLESYEKNVKFYTNRLYSFDWSKQIDRFAESLKGKKVLDAGCGVGRDVGEFLKRDLDVDGLDFSKENLIVAKQKFPKANFIEGDLLKMPLPDRHFDGIWACASILHLKKKDALNALLEFKRVLKPKGVLFVSVKEGTGEKFVEDGGGKRFFSFYSLEELIELARVAGFTVTTTQVVSHFELTGKKEEMPDWLCVFAGKK